MQKGACHARRNVLDRESGPSESPPNYGTRYSEPFRLDYVRWGEEIARLSLDHPNLTAWVIDDFYANHRLPFISMTAGSPHEFRMRHGDPATPERIAQQLRLSLEAWREGKCDGAVTYCLDKRPQSPAFPLAEKLFHQFGAPGVPPLSAGSSDSRRLHQPP